VYVERSDVLFLRSKIPNNSVCGAKRHRNLIKRTKRKRLFRSYSLYSFEGTEGSGNSKKRIQASILEKHSFRFIKNLNKVSGGNNGEETPVPIPNTEVKLSSADDTWVETPWESRSLPDLYESLMVMAIRLSLKTDYIYAKIKSSFKLNSI
jgi:transcription antitermination factor NusG